MGTASQIVSKNSELTTQPQSNPKALVWKSYKGPECGQWQEMKPSKNLRTNEVRVEIRAAGVNYADVLMVNGQYPDAPKTPATPGYEIAGIISEAGKESGFHCGQRVFGVTKFGGYSTELAVPAKALAVIPQEVSFEEAASLPVNALTAMMALEEMARVKEGDKVLIHSASGGVGQMAIQICLLHKAHPIGIVSRESKKTYLEQKYAGLKVIIDSGEDLYANKLLDDGTRIDISLNPVAGRTIKTDLKIMEACGKIIVFGVARASGKGKLGLIKAVAPALLLNPLSSMQKNVGFFGLNLLHFMKPSQEDLIRPNLEKIITYFTDGRLKSHLEETFPMPDAAKAHRKLMNREAIGKLVLVNK